MAGQSKRMVAAGASGPVATKRKKLVGLFAAWDYMAEEDQRAIEEIVQKYEKKLESKQESFFPPDDRPVCPDPDCGMRGLHQH